MNRALPSLRSGVTVSEICVAQQGLGSDGSYMACRLRQPSSGISLLYSCCKLCAPSFKDQRRETQAGDVSSLAISMVKEKITSCGALYLPDSSVQTFQTKLHFSPRSKVPWITWDGDEIATHTSEARRRARAATGSRAERSRLTTWRIQHHFVGRTGEAGDGIHLRGCTPEISENKSRYPKISQISANI